MSAVASKPLILFLSSSHQICILGEHEYVREICLSITENLFWFLQTNERLNMLILYLLKKKSAGSPKVKSHELKKPWIHYEQGVCQRLETLASDLDKS